MASGADLSEVPIQKLAERLHAASAASDAATCGSLVAELLKAAGGEGPTASARWQEEFRRLTSEDVEAMFGELAAVLREPPGAGEPQELASAREVAATALGRFGPSDKDVAAKVAVPALAESLLTPLPQPPREAQIRARTAAVFALADLQDALPADALEMAAPALASVLAGAAGDSEGARSLAAFSLGRLEEAARAFVPLLAQVLDEASMHHLRLSAIGALATMGTAAFSASSRLADLATDSSANP
eukprot:CAMPEP_0171272620 /NCGR_PEP_ID=MMETSP0790-20130122/61857_1 /TAXON_ID=2925 /ORGANISM="Alexandrium catenella, Strain OF101" /LENGTH=245 /DNA_ID=CAMNT_0011741571 /DNA_START=35 /DNA_END=769 /DNA_ORIENTATION=-